MPHLRRGLRSRRLTLRLGALCCLPNGSGGLPLRGHQVHRPWQRGAGRQALRPGLQGSDESVHVLQDGKEGGLAHRLALGGGEEGAVQVLARRGGSKKGREPAAGKGRGGRRGQGSGASGCTLAGFRVPSGMARGAGAGCMVGRGQEGERRALRHQAGGTGAAPGAAPPSAGVRAPNGAPAGPPFPRSRGRLRAQSAAGDAKQGREARGVSPSEARPALTGLAAQLYS